MKIKKGEKLKIRDSRKGFYIGVANKDFDTESDEWYPVVVAIEQEYVTGLTQRWYSGQEIPCRRGLSKVEVL